MDSFPSPSIRSDRLDLREFGADDLGLAVEVVAEGVPEALPPGVPADRDELAAWFATGMYSTGRADAVHLIMLDRASGRMVGAIGVFHPDWQVRSAEIGYGVRTDARSQGYATEALAAVARWLLTEAGIQRAWLSANTDNTASIRVAQKAGFRREGTLRRAGIEDDGLHDLAVFSLLDDDERPELRPEGTHRRDHAPMMAVRSRYGSSADSGSETAPEVGAGFGLRGSLSPAPPPRPG
jgi:RimJ/RimL family protein N-acetyltransferase